MTEPDYEQVWQELGHIDFFWQYLAKKLARLETVQYINFGYKQDLDEKTKGLAWVLVALNH